jgi:hypothetical protein
MVNPCHNCPWRRDAPREHWDPRHFHSISARCRDDGLAVMLCHHSPPAGGPLPELPCAGWIAVEGFKAIGVRLLVLQGSIAAEDVGNAGPELFASFDEMLAANRVSVDFRNRVHE